jgi:hypothetical protein
MITINRPKSRLDTALVPCGSTTTGPRFLGWHLDTLVDATGESVVIPARGPRDVPPLSWTAGRWQAPALSGTLPLVTLPGVSLEIRGGQPNWVVFERAVYPHPRDTPCLHLLADAIEADLGCAISYGPLGSSHLVRPVHPASDPMRWARALGRAALLAGDQDVVGFGRWASGPPPFVAWTAGPNGLEIAMLTPMMG